MTIRYTTRQDAIEQAIMPALTEGDYDLEAICYEAYGWKIDTNERGQELLNTGGFEQTVSDEQFWEIAARHEIDRLGDAERDIAARYPDPDDQDRRDAARAATVQYLAGELDADDVREQLDEAVTRQRAAYAAAIQVAVMMVRGGHDKKGAAHACGINRMTLLKALGER